MTNTEEKQALLKKIHLEELLNMISMEEKLEVIDNLHLRSHLRKSQKFLQCTYQYLLQYILLSLMS